MAAPGSGWLRALGWMMVAILSFTAMAVAGRELHSLLNTFEVMLYRSVVGWLVVCLVLATAGGGFGQVATRHPRLHVVRNLFHFTGQNLWFYSVAAIPLAQLVSLEMTNPLWVALLAPFLLGEKMTLPRALAALLGFAGVLVVIRPGLVEIETGHVTALLAAIGFAMNTIMTKQIMRFDTVLCVLFWMTLSQAAMGLVLSLPGGIPVPGPALIPWVLVAGITGLSAHFALTSALSCAPAMTVAPMEFLRLPVMGLTGWVLYGEPLSFFVFIGAVLIVGGNLINLRGERRPRRS